MTVSAVSSNIGTYRTTARTQTKSSFELKANGSDGKNTYSQTVEGKAETEMFTPQELYYRQSGVSCMGRIPAADTKLGQTKDLGILAMIEEHKLTPDNIKREDDWREMDDEQWKKLIEHIDKYIDDFKEKLERMKEIREEAVMKAMAEAPADMRAMAASMAVLNAMFNGIAGGDPDGDVSYLEKISWTCELQTEDQVILAAAKLANEFAPDMISKAQEMNLIGDTSAGISEAVNAKIWNFLDKFHKDADLKLARLCLEHYISF